MATDKTIVRKARREITEMEGCIQCGRCCQRIKVIATEFKLIKNYLTANNLWDELRMNIDTQIMVAKTYNTKPLNCHLLRMLDDGNTECMAYPVRSIICRLQGVKKELPCPHTDNPQIRIGKWTEMYYELVRNYGFPLNRELELAVKERR